MLKNAALDAKIGFDPAENEPPKEWLCRGRVTAEAPVLADPARRPSLKAMKDEMAGDLKGTVAAEEAAAAGFEESV